MSNIVFMTDKYFNKTKTNVKKFLTKPDTDNVTLFFN